jgi:hypothetical protein
VITVASVKSKLAFRNRGPAAGNETAGVGDEKGASKRRRTLAVPAAVTAILLAAVAVAVLASSSGKSHGAQTEAIQGSSTATVARRELVETDTETGTLGYRDSRNLYNHLSGTVTWVPKAGAVIHADGVLYRVDGSAVYLFNGSLPVYRAFKSGMSDGRDVRQLNRDLRVMGYDEEHQITLNSEFTEATETAIKRWQKAHGMEQTGEIGLGRIAFQPGVRRVQSVSLNVGASTSSAGGEATGAGTGSSTSASGSSTGASYDETSTSTKATAAVYSGGGQTENISNVASAASSETPTTTTPTSTTTTPTTTTPTTTTPTTTTPTTTTPTTTTPSKTRKPSTSPSSGNTATGVSGSGSAAGTGTSSGASTGSSASSVSNLAMVTTSLEAVVTVPLETSKASEARVGDTVQVTLPSTKIVNGRITKVASVAEKTSSSSGSSSSSSTTSTVTVEISLHGGASGERLDQAPVSVGFAASREKSALAVPVTALVATSGGNYAVDVVNGAKRTLVPVTPGLFAGGYVAITGNISEGTVVTVGAE